MIQFAAKFKVGQRVVVIARYSVFRDQEGIVVSRTDSGYFNAVKFSDEPDNFNFSDHELASGCYNSPVMRAIRGAAHE